jgi:hypothetical protein
MSFKSENIKFNHLEEWQKINQKITEISSMLDSENKKKLLKLKQALNDLETNLLKILAQSSQKKADLVERIIKETHDLINLHSNPDLKDKKHDYQRQAKISQYKQLSQEVGMHGGRFKKLGGIMAVVGSFAILDVLLQAAFGIIVLAPVSGPLAIAITALIPLAGIGLLFFGHHKQSTERAMDKLSKNIEKWGFFNQVSDEGSEGICVTVSEEPPSLLN